MIDTLKFARSFQEAGFETRQGEALALGLSEASTQGREELETKTDLRQLEAKMESGFSQVRLEVKASIAEVKADLVRWLIGSQAVLLMALVALANFTRLFQ